MNASRLNVGLVAINLIALIALFMRPTTAADPDVPPVLRIRGLELVDDQGRVRAMLKIFPADPEIKMPDGTKGYPETVLFRLIDSQGAPNVKIAATEDGAGISLGGDADPTYIQLMARGDSTSVTLINKDGHTEVIKPAE